MKNNQKENFFSFAPLGFLNATQFLGAMNDNIFKLLIVFFFIGLEGEAASNTILASVGALYVLPFLVLSSTAGTMADRFSKKAIIVGTKIAECLVMSLGIVSFYVQSKFLAYSSLFLLACHSTIFAPCKYGIVPEIVEKDRISKANGLIASCTYIAIIIGTFLASFITDITNRNFIIAANCSLLFAFFGLYFGTKIPHTPPSGSEKRVTARFITELFHNLKRIYEEPTLLSCVLGSAFFLFIGSYIQLNMIPFALKALHLTDVQGGYLFLLTALGIGIGSLLSGKLSGKRVELGLVPIGGIGMSVCAILISQLYTSLLSEIFLVIAIGVFGGLYLVPLDTFIQVASPNTIRGQVIATTNFLGFFGVLLSAGILYFLGHILGLSPQNGFFVIGVISLVAVLSLSFAISGYFVRYLSMFWTKLKYTCLIDGQNHIDPIKPSVYVSTLSAWPWGLFLTAIQPRRIAIFSQKTKNAASSILQRFFDRLSLRYSFTTTFELLQDPKLVAKIENHLKRKTSIAFFVATDSDIRKIFQFLHTVPKFDFTVLYLKEKKAPPEEFRGAIEQVTPWDEESLARITNDTLPLVRL